MARANRTGVPGLSLIQSGPRAGRYQLDFHYTCPVDRTEKRVGKLYPATLKTAAIKADARGLVNDALTGALARRETAAKASAAKVTIADIAAEVVRIREQDDRSVATLAEFRSVVIGDPASKSPRKGGHIVRHLGTYAPHELDSERLAAFVDALRDGGAGPRTIRNIFKVLSQFIRIVRVRKLDPLLKTNPVRDAAEVGLRLPSKRREAPKRVAWPVACVLMRDDRIPAVRRTRYVVAFLSGLRDGEISGLTWADVDDTEGEGTLRVAKAYALRGRMQAVKTTAAARDVPAHPELARALRLWRAHGWPAHVGREPTPHDPVFPAAPVLRGATASARHSRPASATLLRRDLAAIGATVDAGIDFHAARRTFASALEAARVPHELIERLMGHEPSSVLGQHYAAPDLGVLREAIGRLSLTASVRLRAVS